MNYNHEKTLIFKCSQEDFEKLQELFESGVLNERLGAEVIDMGITSIETSTETCTKPVVLSQWLKGIIEPTWEVVKKLSDNENVNLACRSQNNSNIRCKKSYNLGIHIDSNSVELIVKIEPTQNQGEMNVHLEVKPSKNKPFVPPGLKLILLENSNVLDEVEARNADIFLQRDLTGNIGDSFSVKLELGNISIIENFII